MILFGWPALNLGQGITSRGSSNSLVTTYRPRSRFLSLTLEGAGITR
jgi:hypothetical protein